eukprot:727115_1
MSTPDYLIMIVTCAFVHGQRETLWHSSLHSNTTKWTLYGLQGETNGSIVYSSNCPSSSSCFQYSKNQGLFRYGSTIGYTDIQISYSLRSNGLTDVLNTNHTTIAQEYCYLHYIIGINNTNYDTGWNEWLFVARNRANNATITRNYSLPEAHNSSIVGIRFDTSIGVNDTCWLNDVIISGIPIHTNPSTYESTITIISSTSASQKQPNDLFSIQNILIACAVIVIALVIILAAYLSYKTHTNAKGDPDQVQIQIKATGNTAIEKHAHNDTEPIQPNITAVASATSATIPMEEDAKDSHDLDQVRLWLTKRVQLEQYLDNFVSNGFDKLCFIKDIECKSQLNELGIDKIGHQARLWKYILLLAEEGSEFSLETATTLRDDKLYSHGGQSVLPTRGAGMSTIDYRVFASRARYDPVVRGTIDSYPVKGNDVLMGTNNLSYMDAKKLHDMDLDPTFKHKLSIGSIGSVGSLPSEVTEVPHGFLSAMSVAATEGTVTHDNRDVDLDNELMDIVLNTGNTAHDNVDVDDDHELIENELNAETIC